MAELGPVRRRPTAAELAAQAAAAAGQYAARAAAQAARDYMSTPPRSSAPGPKRYRRSTNYAGRRGRFRTIKREPFDRKEIHTLDTVRTFSSAITAGTGEVNLLNGVAQGDGESERNGRVIKPLAVITKFLYMGQANADEISLRVLLVQDRMPDGTTPTVTDVLDSAQPYSHVNFDNLTRFNILADKVHRLGSIDSGVAARQYFEIACPMTSCGNTYYSDGGATVTSIVKGAFYLLIVPQGGVPANWLHAQSRFTFVDL